MPTRTRRIDSSQLLEFLELVGQELPRKIVLVAAGGSAMTLLKVKPSTRDIDFTGPGEDIGLFRRILNTVPHGGGLSRGGNRLPARNPPTSGSFDRRSSATRRRHLTEPDRRQFLVDLAEVHLEHGHDLGVLRREAEEVGASDLPGLHDETLPLHGRHKAVEGGPGDAGKTVYLGEGVVVVDVVGEEVEQTHAG